MPISAGTSIIQSQFQSALSLQQGATIQSTASILASAVATAAPLGLIAAGPAMIPLIPAGASASVQMLQNALSLNVGAQIGTVSQLIAAAISIIAPLAPPAGLQTLSKQIESALSMQQGATINTTASLVATAIVAYYTIGGVI